MLLVLSDLKRQSSLESNLKYTCNSKLHLILCYIVFISSSNYAQSDSSAQSDGNWHSRIKNKIRVIVVHYYLPLDANAHVDI
jgi:hypothetical protein